MVSKDPDGQSKRYLESFSIPSIALIKDPRPNKRGTTWIANVAGETTCFVDSQSDPNIIQKIKRGEVKLPKLQFTEGRRNVEDWNIVEYEYLKMCPWNEPNKKSNTVRTFFEFKPDEISRVSIERELEDIKIKSKIFELNAVELKAVARVSGALSSSKAFDTIDPSVIKHSLIVKVSTPAGKQQIEDILNDPMLETRYDIYEALDKGFIMWHPTNDNNLMWKSGGVLVNVPAGTQDKIKYSAEYLWHKGRETLNTLRNLLGRLMVTEEQTSTTNDDFKDWLAKATKEEIVDKIQDWCKDNPSLSFLKLNGAYYYFGDLKLATDANTRGKAAVKEYLLSNINVYNMVYQEWIKLVL